MGITSNRLRKFCFVLLMTQLSLMSHILLSQYFVTSIRSKSSTGGNNNTPAAIAENALRVASTGVGELDVPTMKKYIQYAKAKCAPRLSEDAGDILASSYVKIRDDVRRRVMEVSVTMVSLLFLNTNASSNHICVSFYRHIRLGVSLKQLCPLQSVSWRLLFVSLKVWLKCASTPMSKVKTLQKLSVYSKFLL